MAREVQIATWCDHCLAEGEQTAATEYAGLNSSGVRVVVDLCDEHVVEYLDPALGVFDSYGRGEAKTQGKRRKMTPASGPCPECGREFASAQAVGMHRWRKHGVSRKDSQSKAS